MTVILVLGTFLVFIAVDYAMNRRRALVAIPMESHEAAPVTGINGPGKDFVNGFHVPENLSYHAGHSWLVRERKNVVRVGADEFAAALAGKVERIELPRKGQWIRQGQRVLSFYRNGEKTEMVSPTEGEVMEVNAEAINNPSIVRDDPYGKGWLVAVHVPDEEATSRNLIPTSLVKEWMRESVERLYAMQPQFAGAVAADGGRPAHDLLAACPEANWHAVTAEFFLTM